jgi:hypothetical protein
MKMNKWTVGLAAAGVVSLASTAQAEENSVLTSLGSTVLSGSVEASYIGGFSSDNNLYSDGGFGAHGASLSVGSPLGGGDYAAGYNVELLLGQRAASFAGAGDEFLLKNANVGMSLPFGNGIDLTLGLFDTIVGYEVEASASNPNVMRSYGYGIEPFTHTGLLASTSIAEGLNFSAALINQFDSTDDTEGSNPNNASNDGHAQLGYGLAVEYTLPDSLGFLAGNSVYVGYVNGNDDGNVATGDTTGVATNDNSLLYIGANVNTPIEGLSLGLAYDDREWSTNDWEAQTFAVYGQYALSDSTSVGLRYDTGEFDTGATGEDSAQMITVTLNHQLWDNLTTRFEVGYENGAGALLTNALQTAGGNFDPGHFSSPYGVRDNDGVEAGGSSYFALNAFYAF